jgi:predicted nucleic acid-binding protein
VVYDTDVLIWALRDCRRATRLIDDTAAPAVSVVSYLELLQGARDSQEVRAIKSYLADVGFEVLPLSENIGHRAAIYMEQHALATPLDVADALIAATASQNGLPLATGNKKHFSAIQDVEIIRLRPR